MYFTSVAVFFVILISGLRGNELKGFDDTILFDVRWLGDLHMLDHSSEKQLETMTITTAHQEKYTCTLPNVIEKESTRSEGYTGPVPVELLSPLFSQSACSYRLESYWTYEICHGRYVRQYHEDREGKKMRLQEYYLGRWDKDHYRVLVDKAKSSTDDPVSSVNAPVKKIDGVNLPYLELEMGNGTLCDLNDKPRTTKLLYVCYPHGKHEIYSLKEISTCTYEVIVLSPLLCAHPKYAPSNTEENIIDCRPLDGAPSKPRGLLEMRADSWKYRRGGLRQRAGADDHIRVEIHSLGEIGEPVPTTIPPQPETPADISPVKAFLTGQDCLYGGTGWWKYEFCYGKTVQQYHVHKDGSRTTILLGKFDEDQHINWITANPHKKPGNTGAAKKQLSHFYSDGAECEKTGKPRQTIVKLKCLEGTTGAVSLYLLEPKYCEYVLGVESPVICEILDRADEYGLVHSDVMDEIMTSSEEELDESHEIITS